MQPLALQNASITADTGENGGTPVAPGKSSNGANFGALMAAVATPAAAGVGEPQTDAALPEDSAQIDEAVAALAAATQMAARGVSLKVTPAPVDADLSLAALPVSEELTNETTPDLADGQTENAFEPKADEQPAELAAVIDPANMNVQALIQLVASASMTVPESVKDAKTETEFPETPSTPQPDTSVSHALADIATIETVNSLTPIVATDAPMQAETEEASETPAPPRIAALQSVPWFESHAPKPQDDPEVAEAEDNSEPVSPAPSIVGLNAPTADAASSDEPSAEQTQLDPSTQAMDPDLLPMAASAIAVAPPVNGSTNPGNGELRSNTDPLLRPTNTPVQHSSAPATPRKVTTESQEQVPASHTTAGDKVVEVSSPSDIHSAAPLNPVTKSAASFVREAAVANTQASDIRGVTQLSPSIGSAEVVPQLAAAPLAHVAAEFAPVKDREQDADADEAQAELIKPEDEVVADASTETSAKNKVHIRELLKLGVTDVTLSHEAPPLMQPVETDAPPPAPLADALSGASSAPQVSTVAKTNIETNGERRSIADDIRLRALERMVVNAARNGTQVLSIQLYPPGLGQVVLRLAMDGQRLRLATRAATTEAADTLRNMENDLRNALAGNGLQLAGFDVSEDGLNDEAPRKQAAEPIAKTRSGGTDESFTVELNA